MGCYIPGPISEGHRGNNNKWCFVNTKGCTVTGGFRDWHFMYICITTHPSGPKATSLCTKVVVTINKSVSNNTLTNVPYSNMHIGSIFQTVFIFPPAKVKPFPTITRKRKRVPPQIEKKEYVRNYTLEPPLWWVHPDQYESLVLIVEGAYVAVACWWAWPRNGRVTCTN